MTSLCLNVLYTKDSIKHQLAPFSVELTFSWEAITKSTYQIHTRKKYTMEQGEKKNLSYYSRYQGESEPGGQIN